MRLAWVFLLLFQSLSGQQKHINIQNNYGAAGYDLVSYFNSKAEKGTNKFSLKHEGLLYRFVSETNLNKPFTVHFHGDFWNNPHWRNKKETPPGYRVLEESLR